jgi:hypothetical protein
MSDLTLRAAFLQWPEENQCSLEIKPQDITSALAAGRAFTSREFVDRLCAHAKVCLKKRHAADVRRQLVKLAKQAAAQQKAADAEAAAAKQQAAHQAAAAAAKKTGKSSGSGGGAAGA